ncbi:unnamed protein product [Haemonchus placei]|uniref:Uncharacterized protein n=1 Tax=Haemonchus placei TaxID=6290 RepID=A0A3P7TV15_HAEPC|nr:unnamed protein product [Haemonchus placei]
MIHHQSCEKFLLVSRRGTHPVFLGKAFAIPYMRIRHQCRTLSVKHSCHPMCPE